VTVDSAAALETLYRSRYPRFVATAAALCGAEQAHDAVQDAFARALRARRRPSGLDELERYVWRIVLNSAKDALKRRPEASLDEALGLHAVDDARDPAIAEALRGLAPRRRAVVFLFHLADLPLAEIADLLGISQGTVSATLAQARDALRQALEGAAR
jgi:RNA polymerase sigma-70 factor (ECF subfamily)